MIQTIGLTARLIRGASLIEMMSSIRHSVIEEFGIGSIVIDGGGRLEFVAEYNPNDLLNRSVSRTLIHMIMILTPPHIVWKLKEPLTDGKV